MSTLRHLLVALCLFVVATEVAANPSVAEALEAEGLTPASLADEVEAAWQTHDLRWWFPRVVDPDGGFFEEFDENGEPIDTARTCIFQARMTWVAATIADRRPQLRGEFEPIARHGFAYLRDVMVNADHGGVYWGIGLDGKPMHDGERHLYNTAFAIYAAAAFEKALPGEGGKELGESLLYWVDEHGHDEANGGYAEHYAADGHAIVSADDPDASVNGQGPLMPPYGYKSMNAHIHLLEALAALYEVAPSALLERRLSELYAIISERFYDEPGLLHLWTHADYTPVADWTSYGHNIETAYLLVEAAESLHRGDEPELWEKARALVDVSIATGWDETHGGLSDAGSIFQVRDATKFWWVQAESLNALLMMADHVASEGGDPSPYIEAFVAQWGFICEHMLDDAAGGNGWIWGLDEEMQPLPRSKANAWKTSYHTSRALLNVADRLRQMDQ